MSNTSELNSDTVNVKLISMTLVLIMAIVPITIAFDSDGADVPFTVMDGEGNTFVFDSPVDKIITIGVGVTATAIGVGALDKIVVCDKYSNTNSDPIFNELKEYVKEGKIAANGSIYSSGKEQLKTDIIDASEPTKEGHFDREKDAIIAVVSPSYRANLDFLEENGFKNVLNWSTVSSYDEIVDFVETISMICNGEIDENAAAMKAVKEKIFTTLHKERPDIAKAFYVTYSSGTFKVGNTSSITTAMIEAAGGEVVTKDDSKSASTIEINLTELVANNPGVIIFADNQVFNSAEHMKNLRNAVGDDVEIKGLEAIWNNFSIESAKGVWAMAGSMYPDLFDGKMPSAGGSSSDLTMYAGSGIVAVVVILVASYLLMRPI